MTFGHAEVSEFAPSPNQEYHLIHGDNLQYHGYDTVSGSAPYTWYIEKPFIVVRRNLGKSPRDQRKILYHWYSI